MASSKTLEGRTAVVTGASRGIGRAIATLFAAEGADVTLVSRSADALGDVFAEITRRGGRALVVAADVTADDAPAQIVDRTLAEFGGLDILVNNAGGNSFMAPLETMRFSGWQKTMALNLDSTVRLIQAALPPMIAGGRGSIINVSSVTGLRGSPLMSHYGAAKAAVISLSQSLGIELATRRGARELPGARAGSRPTSPASRAPTSPSRTPSSGACRWPDGAPPTRSPRGRSSSPATPRRS